MKKLCLIVALLFLTCGTLDALAGQNEAPGKAIAYYFHGDFRCPTCRKLEQYSKEAVETNFKDALSSGQLEFRVVNVEGRGNEHFVKDYQLYTKALVISLVRGGKEIKFKNLTKIWDYVGDKNKFVSYVTEEVSTLLKKIR